jgi:hypothetical protein
MKYICKYKCTTEHSDKCIKEYIVDVVEHTKIIVKHELNFLLNLLLFKNNLRKAFLEETTQIKDLLIKKENIKKLYTKSYLIADETVTLNNTFSEYQVGQILGYKYPMSSHKLNELSHNKKQVIHYYVCINNLPIQLYCYVCPSEEIPKEDIEDALKTGFLYKEYFKDIGETYVEIDTSPELENVYKEYITPIDIRVSFIHRWYNYYNLIHRN